MNLTHRDHLSWHLSLGAEHRKPFGIRLVDDEQFNFSLGKCSSNRGWATEFRSGISKLIDEHGTDLALFYSGGSDSEIVLRELLAQGVTPEIHTIKFGEGLNEHETTYAGDFCAAHNLTQYIWEHDARDYINSGKYLDIANKYLCSQLAYITVLEFAQRVNLPVIMGGEVYFQKHPKDDGRVKSDFEWYYIYREDEDGVTYRYSRLTGHPIINEVFTYTPEMLYSWMTTPEVSAVANNELPGKITLLSAKKSIYERELGYSLTAKTKYTGYELLGWSNMHVQRSLKASFPKMQTRKIEYSELLESLVW